MRLPFKQPCQALRKTIKSTRHNFVWMRPKPALLKPDAKVTKIDVTKFLVSTTYGTHGSPKDLSILSQTLQCWRNESRGPRDARSLRNSSLVLWQNHGKLRIRLENSPKNLVASVVAD